LKKFSMKFILFLNLYLLQESLYLKIQTKELRQGWLKLRVIFKLLQEELQKLIQFFEGKVVTSVTSMQTLSPGSKIIEGKDLALKTSPFLFSNEIT